MKQHGIARLLSAGITCLALVGACACGGARTNTAPTQFEPAQALSQPVAAAGLDSVLPAPSSLAANLRHGKSVAYVEADLTNAGNEYNPALPLQHMSFSATSAFFDSGWAPGDPFANLAFCTYVFTAGGYNRNAQVRLHFPGTPPNRLDTWIALAEWSEDRWRWFRGSETVGNEVRFNLPSFAPYFDFGGNMLVVPVVTDGSGAELDYVRLGADPPVAALTASPTIVNLTENITLDASGSSTPEGSITTYEYDTNGDGTFDINTAADVIGIAFPANGTYHPAVRVTNSFGITATASTTVHAVGDWTHTWGRPGAEDIDEITLDADGYIYGVGTFFSAGGPLTSDLLLMKWSPTGEVVWAKTYDSGDSDYGISLELDSAGDLVAAGGTDAAGDRDVLLTKWDTAGTLLLAQSCGGSGFEQALELELDGTDIYVAGQSSSLSAEDDVFILKFEGNGLVDWQAGYDRGGADYLEDLDLKWTPLIGSSGLIATIQYESGSSYYASKLETGLDGSLSSVKDLNLTSLPMRDLQLIRTHNLLTGITAYYVAGVVDILGERLFLSRTDGSGNSVYCTLVTSPNAPTIEDMNMDANGDLIVTGFGQTVGTSLDAVAYKFDPADGAYFGCLAWGQESDQCRGYSVKAYQQGFLLSGFAQNAAGTQVSPAYSTGLTSFNFFDSSASTVPVSWFVFALPQNTEDVTAEGTLDTGAGTDDTLMMYRSSF